MKSERRHELQTNYLADWVGHQVDSIRPYTRAIAGTIGAIIVIFLVYSFVSHQQFVKAGMAWQSYLLALRERDQDDQAAALQKVARDEGGTPAGVWALQTEADLDLDRGSRLLFTDRDEAVKTLERAEKNFEQVETLAQRDRLLLERARFGLAQTQECLGKLEKAKQKYESVAKANPEGAFGKLAATRLAALGDKRMSEFYAWFEQQKPAPRRALPGRGRSPFGGLDDLPDAPNLKLPGLTGGGAAEDGGESKDKPEGKPAETPEGGDEKPADKSTEKPAEDKTDAKPGDKPEEAKPADKPGEKADEKPAAGDKPAGEKPAEKPSEKPAEKPAESKEKP
ncbi:MAG TPA: hypothetical protein PLV92_09215 [Pirellulaceae bacterium]|nr:hypothetical protein [Pirellulaceae bacterium]